MALIDGLVSYYKLDESSGTVLDTETTNDLTNSGAVANSTGKINTAYLFNLTTDVISTTSASSLPLVDVSRTMACWFKATNFGGSTRPMFSIGTGATNNAFSMAFGIGGSGDDILSLWGYSNDYSGTTTLSTATWYHLAVTYNTSTGSLISYINGTKDIDTTASNFNTSGTNIIIGDFRPICGPTQGDSTIL